MKNNETPFARKVLTVEIFTTWQTYWDACHRMWGDIDKERSAERNLQALRQTKSAVEYANKFAQYVVRADWSDKALLVQYYLGLKDEVKDAIVSGE